MIHTDRAIVVEGKYDKIKLSSMVDGVIICTGGFRVYKDKEMQAMLRALAKKQGLAVLTDSDTAGFKIRGFLRSICGKENIVDVYIPDLYGKEKRKDHPSKEGKLGVEGIDDAILLSLFEKADIKVTRVQNDDPITSIDMFELGLSGTPNAKQNKKKLLKSLDLPEFLSTSSLISYLNSIMSKNEFYKYCNSLFTDF